MGKTYMTVHIEKECDELIDQCREVYYKHHPYERDEHKSKRFMIKQALRYYRDY